LVGSQSDQLALRDIQTTLGEVRWALGIHITDAPIQHSSINHLMEAPKEKVRAVEQIER
jgi:site-specific recombinase XerC